MLNKAKHKNQMQMHENMIPKTNKKSRKKVQLQIERIKVEDKQKYNQVLGSFLTHTTRVFGREDEKACVLVCLLKDIEELRFS